MRSTRLALAIVLGALARSSSASAQRVELAGRVTASRTVLSQRRVGEARYIALSDLFYRDRSAYLEVLDLVAPAARSVIQVRARRALFEKRFGVARDSSVAPPQGEIVLYRDGVVGIALAEAAVAAARHHWYVELDAYTGKLLRTADLAVLYDGEGSRASAPMRPVPSRGSRSPSTPRPGQSGQLCVRGAFCSSVFPLASPFPSTTSAAALPALFGGFSGTMGMSDFPCPFITGLGPLGLSQCGPPRHPRRALRGSPVSRAGRFHTCEGSATAPGRLTPRDRGVPVLPSASRNGIGTQHCLISRLNILPMCAPVNASTPALADDGA